jgi:hypothetical protein
MAEHATLTGANLHEPKGVAAAASGAVYVADGAGSGAWTIALTVNRLTLTGKIADVSTADELFIPVPLDCQIIKAYCTIKNAITVANTILTLKIGGVAVTNGTITLTQAASAAGSTFSCTPTAANTAAAGQAIQISCDGGSTTAAEGVVTLLLKTV